MNGQVDFEGVPGASASNGDTECDRRGEELALIGSAGISVADKSELEMIA